MATEYPILIFPEPQRLDRETRRFVPPQIHYPSFERQRNRLSPLFNTLRRSFEARRMEIQQTPEGVDPEQVLIFETIGSVDNFITAVRHTAGLDWLGEIEIDDIQPTEDFYARNDNSKSLSGRLFLTMANQQALNEILSLWNQYIHNPEIQFRTGLAGFKSMFQKLKNIRRWDINDRLLETGIIEYWHQEILSNKSLIRFELQLWFSNSVEKQQQKHRVITELIESLGGHCITYSIIKEISYHALLVELPASEINKIINSPTTRLVKYDGIMFFRPVGQVAIDTSYEEDDDEDETKDKTHWDIQPAGADALLNNIFPTGDPVVALFDGLPVENHNLLTHRLIVDDPDNFSDNYEAQYRRHGTGMSSLIIHGDLNDHNLPIRTPLYVRPIMKLMAWYNDDQIEKVPDNVLFVDLIHRSVKRIFEGENNNRPLPSIKVINLSICDPNMMFYHTMSPMAKLLDWLSFKYKVLFIISAGNHLDSLKLPILYKDFKLLSDNDKEITIYRAVANDMRNRRLLSPAESINNITVGSIHYDISSIREYDRRINPSQRLLPNVHSSFGGGFRRAIKPDMVYPGGRQLFKEVLRDNSPTLLEYSCNYAEPGHRVAAPSPQLTKTYFTRGTSNATALITRESVRIIETLKEVLQENYDATLYMQYIPLLIKVMLIHGCSWGELEINLHRILSGIYTNADIQKIITKWVGYGLPNIDKVIKCTEQRITVLGFGELNADKVHLFKFPLPPSLSARPESRKLTVSLGWFSPIAPNTQKYRVASLYFEVGNQIIGVNRDDAHWQTVRKGTLQHEVFIGSSAIPYEDGQTIDIKVICKQDAIPFQETIPYAIAVSLEVAEEARLPIYQEVKNRIITPIVVEQPISH